MAAKTASPVELAAQSVINLRREAAKIYAAYFAGAPVNDQVEETERRLLEVLLPIYRKRVGGGA